MKSIINFMFALAFNFIAAVSVNMLTNWSVSLVFGALTLISLIPKGAESSSYAFAGLNKEIWINQILEKFYPNASFLTESRDFSEFVENNTINLAEVGVDPAVLINNSSYPIAINQRVDSPIALPLDVYDTENTLVRNAEQVELSYNKMESVVRGHRNALLTTMAKKAGHNWSPDANTTNTPVFGTTGSAVGGKLNISFDDLDKMQEKFNLMDMPEEGRILLLHPTHKTQLQKEDRVLYKALMAGELMSGFKVYNTGLTPIYNKTTLVKAAYGAAAAPATDTISSVFYFKEEVMRCDGDTTMFERLKDPEQRGDIIGFQKRALVLPFRQKNLGAIVTADAV